MEGSNEDVIVGKEVGLTLGKYDGIREGTEVEDDVGVLEGYVLILGKSLLTLEGIREGVDVGISVERLEGYDVGL